MPKVTMVESNTVTDENGEIKQQSRTVTWNYGKEPDYIKIYLDNIMFLAELQGWVSKVLYELIKSTSYADKGQLIIVNAGYKRIVAEKLDMKPQSITNAINYLVKNEILIKQEQGVFLLNPMFFGRGEWKDIAKIRYEIELSGKGKTLKLKSLERTEEE